MGQVTSIRPDRAGPAFERAPRVSTFDRVLLSVLCAAGIYALLLFGEYWFFSQARRTEWLFWLVSLPIFWRPLRSVYNWWVYLWANEARDPLGEVGSFSGPVNADVLTTAMPGEPYSMFAVALPAMAQIRGVNRVYLLDGGYDARLHDLCERSGIVHVDCRGVGGAKAGKVNYCLREFSRAEFVLVIDPDHIPRPDFFERTLPWLRDPEVGFVQVVQAYYNLRDNWIAWGAAEQTFGFYGPTLMGLHGLGLPTAIGANCTFRRSALDAIGGHGEHLAEDAVTSLRLHAHGYRSIYLPWRGSEGLVPNTLNAFWKQQLKWAAGMTQLLVGEYPKLFRKMSPLVRVHYLVAGTFYVCGLTAALNFTLPALCLLFGGYAIDLPVEGFLLHLLPYLLISFTVDRTIQRWYSHSEEEGFPYRSMALEQGTWHIYFLGFLFGVIGKKVPYLPTPKGGDQKVSLLMLAPHLGVIFASAVGILVASRSPRLERGTILMMGFAAVNVLVLLPTTIQGLWGNLKFLLGQGSSTRASARAPSARAMTTSLPLAPEAPVNGLGG